MKTAYRIGTFFILAGLALLIIFIVSMVGKEAHGIYLFLSLAAFALGFLLHRNKTVNDSGRFGMIRRANERRSQRRKKGMGHPARGNPLAGREQKAAQERANEEDNGNES
jgi:hypothetical protein